MAVSIACSNSKGGIGKTSTALALAADLQNRGYRVLMVDTNPQRHATIVYRAETEDVATLYDIFFGGYKAKECIQKTEYGDIIASDQGLRTADSQIKPGPGMYKYIRNALKEVEEEYDFIIFDTQPHEGVVLGNVLMYVNYLIIPCTCDSFGVQGLTDFYDTISEYREDNENLSILGVLIIKYKGRQNLTKEIEEETLPNFAKQMNTVVFDTRIRESVKIQEAQTLCVSLYDYAPNSTTAVDYDGLVDEILKKLKMKKEVKRNGRNRK